MKTSQSSGQKAGFVDQLLGQSAQSKVTDKVKSPSGARGRKDDVSFEDELRSLIARSDASKSRSTQHLAADKRPSHGSETRRELPRSEPRTPPQKPLRGSVPPSQNASNLTREPNPNRKTTAQVEKQPKTNDRDQRRPVEANTGGRPNSSPRKLDEDRPPRDINDGKADQSTKSSKKSAAVAGKEEQADAVTKDAPVVTPRRVKRRGDVEEEIPAIDDIRAVLGQGADVSKKIPALALLSGRLDQIAPEKIPSIVSDSAFINVAMSLPEPTPTLKTPVALGVLLKDLGAEAGLLQELNEQGVDLNMEVAPADLFSGLGVDSQRVATELKLLKANVQMDEGLSPYIQRAQKMHRRLQEKSGESNDDSIASARRPEAIADHMRHQEKMQANQSIPSNVNSDTAVSAPTAPTAPTRGQQTSRPQNESLTLQSEESVFAPSEPNLNSEKLARGPVVTAMTRGPITQLSPRQDVAMAKELMSIDQQTDMESDEVLDHTAFQMVSRDPFKVTDAKMNRVMDVEVGDLAQDQADPEFLQEPSVTLESAPAVSPGLKLSDAQRLVVDQAQRDWFGGLVAESKSTDFESLPEIPVNVLSASQGTQESQVSQVVRAPNPFQLGAQLTKAEVSVDAEAGVASKQVAAPLISRGDLTQRDGQQMQGDQSQSGQQGFQGQDGAQNSLMADQRSVMQSRTETDFDVGTSVVPSSKMTGQIVRQAEMMVKEGGGSVRLELNTEEHGRVELAMRVDNDRLELRIIAGSDAARQALTDQLPRLKESLDQQNLELADVQVGVGSEQLQQGFARDGDQRQDYEDQLSGKPSQLDAGRVTPARKLAANIQKSAANLNHNGKIQVSV